MWQFCSRKPCPNFSINYYSAAAAAAGPVTGATDPNLPGTTLSDVEQQAISDPSTDDLVAAATGDLAAAAVRDEPVEANVSTVQPDESSDVKGGACWVLIENFVVWVLLLQHMWHS